MGPMNTRIETDSSLSGFGRHDVTYNVEYSGSWEKADKTQHINYLELKAAILCLKYFCDNVTNEHIHLFMDNVVLIKYISKMGGRKPLLNELAKQLWAWCEERNILILAFYIPGRLNTRADELSNKRIRAMKIWNGHYNKTYTRKYPIKWAIVRWTYLPLQNITNTKNTCHVCQIKVLSP